ncbi:unnamed protein product [Pieris macdunnoughi]|uniref:Uncharacterized protein n=1 Tax=Pieris macdunnoughi TaxID=345717 RepID=A0A821TY07_9NEOP|nr:unnamed protein product [Pieris macdunnoughi]
MDSDIDIEEHNLFENPELRVLFPDITALKQEIYDEYVEVTNIPNDRTTLKREYQLELAHSQHFDENQQRAGKKKRALQEKTCILKNKIVIGSEPKSSKTTYSSMKHNITKQVIEHCQIHILNNRDPKTNIEHREQDVNSKDSIDGRKVYYFEPYYYAKDDIWLKHLFNGLSLEEITKKLPHSIYRFESRIKLEISQEAERSKAKGRNPSPYTHIP